MKDFDACTVKEKVARWENVIRVLRGLTRHQRKKHWDMSGLLDETPCGTIGCAAGWCSLDPWFRRRGIKATLRDGWWEYEGLDWHLFWGEGQSIFQDRTRRPVGKVIREIKAHIKELRAEAP